MDLYTFIAACELAVDSGDYISLGGGEPTIHPRFWKFFNIAHRYNERAGSGLSLLVVTNGSMAKTALSLARRCENDKTVDVVLSRDNWHDPIDSRVVQAYQHLKQAGREGIRSNMRITKHGSALANQQYTEENDCCCPTSLVYPTGKLYGCGCRKFAFGTVFQPSVPDWHQSGECVVQEHKSLCSTS